MHSDGPEKPVKTALTSAVFHWVINRPSSIPFDHKKREAF